MAEHPIQGLMRTALESLKEMVDVNTVVGDPVRTPDGQVVIPVSRVTLGFAAGGTEFGRGGQTRYGRDEAAGEYEDGYGGSPDGFPFGGGSGAGVSVQPVGFLVVGRQGIRLLTVSGGKAMDRLLDVAPQILERLAGTRERRRVRDGEHPADELAGKVIDEALPGAQEEDGVDDAGEVAGEPEDRPRVRAGRTGAAGGGGGQEAGKADRIVRRVTRTLDDAGRGGRRRP